MAQRAVVAMLSLLVVVTPAAQSATARTVRFESHALGGQVTFAILVPRDYESSGKRYPVVYLLHGGTQNHTAFPARTWFANEVLARDIIAVMPHVPPSAYPRGGSAGGVVERFLADDLIGYVDANYRTIPSRHARAIGGLSMGGYGAVLTAIARPDLFATVGTFSGAVGGERERQLATAIASLPSAEAPFFYLACGIADPLLPASRALAKALATRGIIHEYREVPGAHTWDVWAPQTLAFLDAVTSRPGFLRAR